MAWRQRFGRQTSNEESPCVVGQAPGDAGDSLYGEDSPQPGGHVPRGRGKIKLPGHKAMQKVAKKAGTATTKSMKATTTKMKGLANKAMRRGDDPGAYHTNQDEAAECSLEGTAALDDFDEDPFADEDNATRETQSDSELLCSAQARQDMIDAPSTPGTTRGSDGPDRSASESSGSAGSEQETHRHEGSSDSDRRQPVAERRPQPLPERRATTPANRKVQPARVAPVECRALQFNSIWDIPTSRVPEPKPQPARSAPAPVTIGDAARMLPAVAVSLAVPSTDAASAKTAAGRQGWDRARTAAMLGFVLLSASAVAAVAAMSGR